MDKNFGFFLILVLALSSCGGKGIENRYPDSGKSGLPPADPVVTDPSGWQVSRLKSDDGSVGLTRRQMSAEEQKRLRQEYSQTDLVQIPIGSQFNVTLFKIKNVEEYVRTVFVAPKLFAYGSSEHGRIAPRRNPDGTVSLSFPVVLTDGTVEKILAPSAEEVIPLPASYLIQKYSDLVSQVRESYGSQITLAPLPGCPKQITVLLGDHEYDATPKDLASGDYCQLNSPFTVTVTLPEDEARYLLEKGLYTGIVDARAVFETRVAFAVSHFKIEFEKEKLFRDISAALGVKTFYADVDVRAKVTEVIRNQAMRVSIKGEMNSHLDAVVSQAIDLFFEPFRADPDTKLKECGPAMVCFRLNFNYSKEESSLSFEWYQSSNALTGQNYITWTKLKPIQDRTVRFGEAGCQGSQCRPLLSNLGGAIETGLTILPGDLLEITPETLRREKRELEIPTTARADNNVCLATEPVMKERCRSIGGFGKNAEGEICTNVKVGDRCVQAENRWIETTNYSMGLPEFITVSSPVAQLEQLFDGLALRFVWRKNGSGGDGSLREVTCPVNLFKRDGDGKSLVVRISNQPGCKIFSDNPDESPMLYLVNKIDFPVKYRKGRYVRNWTGAEIEKPSTEVYHPQVDLSGFVSIKGYNFSSAAAGGRKQ